jgi:hypothetical protein
MMQELRSAKLEVIWRLLEAHERSCSFGQPGPWPRDVIISLDPRTFPSAFGADGRDALAALCRAIEELREAGACRVVYEKTRTAGTDRLPHQVRVGPGELATAYAIGIAAGFEPLAAAIERVRQQIARLAPSPMTAWLRDFLERADAGLVNADPGVLGMSRERFKRDSVDVADALAAAVAISGGIDAWERTLSERLFGRPGRLSEIRTLVAKLLLRSDPGWAGFDLDGVLEVLEAYGVRCKPGTLRCAGSGSLLVNGRAYELADFVPTASLPEAWGRAWCEAVVTSRVSCITTIENEDPFLSYVEEVGGVAGLADRRELVVHVAGFPAPWLTWLLADAQRRTGATLRHWGDADVDGLLIWRLLRTRIDAPIELFRTTDAWVRAHAAHGGQPLASREHAAIHRLCEIFESRREPDFAQAAALAHALLETSSKLEQARYAPAGDAPARDAPARDAPARDAPARDAPARDAPARDAPAPYEPEPYEPARTPPPES